MNIAITGPVGSGAAAAAPAFQAPPPAAAPAVSAAEDKVTISAAAQEVPQPISVQVLALHNQGQSVPQIATQLAIKSERGAKLFGTPPAAAK